MSTNCPSSRLIDVLSNKAAWDGLQEGDKLFHHPHNRCGGFYRQVGNYNAQRRGLGVVGSAKLFIPCLFSSDLLGEGLDSLRLWFSN